jgi:hypothetical protein
MLFAALDQGERLDWWRSGVFTALVLGGSLFLLSSLVRRLRSPNPLVDLPYLRQWNTLLLGVGLILFRFNLLGTIILIPQSLAIHGFEADQIGPAVIWCAVPVLLVALIAGLLLAAKLDSRFLLATGFAAMALAAYLNAELTSAWSVELLPHRIADGRRAVVCVYRPGRRHCASGYFFGRIIETAVGSYVFCFLSRDTTLRRTDRRGFHGPLRRAAREAALKSPGPARAER